MSHVAAVMYDRCFFWLLWRNWTWTFWTRRQHLHITLHLHQGIFSWTHSSSGNVLLFHLIVGNSRIILFLGILWGQCLVKGGERCHGPIYFLLCMPSHNFSCNCSSWYLLLLVFIHWSFCGLNIPIQVLFDTTSIWPPLVIPICLMLPFISQLSVSLCFLLQVWCLNPELNFLPLPVTNSHLAVCYSKAFLWIHLCVFVSKVFRGKWKEYSLCSLLPVICRLTVSGAPCLIVLSSDWNDAPSPGLSYYSFSD